VATARAARIVRAAPAAALALAATLAVALAGARAAQADEPLDLSPPARAAPAPAESSEEKASPDEPSVTAVELRFGWFEQDGYGYQSQTNVSGFPGSEQATIAQPMALFRIRQGPRIEHTVVIPIDVVSAASPDALDAISSASRRNESAGVDMTTVIHSGVDDFALRWGAHFEEPLRAATWGGGWTRHLAEDNATVSVSGNATFDYFDNISQQGFTDGQDSRISVNGNLGASQILSPTTLFDASYGLTYQSGLLEQTWNAVPRGIAHSVLGEKFPHQRTRHALFGRIAQIVPLTRTTLKLSYRYYRDDFGLDAHTVEVRAYQYLARWLVVRGSYRVHTQSAVDFYTEDASKLMEEPLSPRTADSDLAAFDADELGVKLMLVPGRLPWAWLRPHSLALSFQRYTRDNGLHMDVLAIEWGREL
jgi:hypothetical protein